MAITRRAALKAGFVAAAAAPMINLGSFELFAQSNQKYSARALNLVQQATVIDMLNPFSLYATLADLMPPGPNGAPRTWFSDPTTFTQADLQPFRESGIN